MTDETESLDYVELKKHALASQNILLHAPGGTGKTYMLKQLVEHLRSRGWVCAMTALTGVASLNCGGSTLHSWAGVGLAECSAETLIKRVMKSNFALRRWRKTRLLVIDEVSMMSADFFDKLDVIAKSVLKSSKPFGGLQVIVSGDFFQLPPVEGGWVFGSDRWRDMKWKLVTLSIPMRYSDNSYFELLLRVRQGKHTLKDIEFLQSRVTPPIPINGVLPTRVFPLRRQADAINAFEMRKLQAESVEFKASDFQYGKFPVSDRTLEDMIPEVIELCVGAQVLLRANIDPSRGLVNGSRGVVTKITDEGIVSVMFLNGVETPVDTWVWKVFDSTGELQAERVQIPLQLAWGISTHKVQGLTLDAAVCSLGSEVFADGQAYVALSRVKSGNGLFLDCFDESSIKYSKIAAAYVEELNCVGEIK